MIRRFARPYAEALLGSLPGTAAAEKARDELELFCRALEEVPELGRMASNPAIPLEVKERVLEEVGASLGLSTEVGRLLQLLLTHYRLPHSAAVFEAVDQILKRRLGVVSAEITSAAPLGDSQRDRLRETLARLLDREVELRVEVDPDLLGGFVALVGSRRYDASVRGQLHRLASSLSAAEGSSN